MTEHIITSIELGPLLQHAHHDHRKADVELISRCPVRWRVTFDVSETGRQRPRSAAAGPAGESKASASFFPQMGEETLVRIRMGDEKTKKHTTLMKNGRRKLLHHVDLSDIQKALRGDAVTKKPKRH